MHVSATRRQHQYDGERKTSERHPIPTCLPRLLRLRIANSGPARRHEGCDVLREPRWILPVRRVTDAFIHYQLRISD